MSREEVNVMVGFRGERVKRGGRMKDHQTWIEYIGIVGLQHS
jgi:hypothetical protein